MKKISITLLFLVSTVFYQQTHAGYLAVVDKENGKYPIKIYKTSMLDGEYHLEEYATLEGHDKPINSLEYQPNNKNTLVSASEYGKTIKVWDIENQKCIKEIKGDELISPIISFSKNPKTPTTFFWAEYNLKHNIGSSTINSYNIKNDISQRIREQTMAAISCLRVYSSPTKEDFFLYNTPYPHQIRHVGLKENTRKEDIKYITTKDWVYYLSTQNKEYQNMFAFADEQTLYTCHITEENKLIKKKIGKIEGLSENDKIKYVDFDPNNSDILFCAIAHINRNIKEGKIIKYNIKTKEFEKFYSGNIRMAGVIFDHDHPHIMAALGKKDEKGIIRVYNTKNKKLIHELKLNNTFAIAEFSEKEIITDPDIEERIAYNKEMMRRKKTEKEKEHLKEIEMKIRNTEKFRFPKWMLE